MASDSLTPTLGDTVECRICGKELQSLNFHLLKHHKMPVCEYKNTFPGSPTESDLFKSRKSERLSKVVSDKWKDEDWRAKKIDGLRLSTKEQWKNPEFALMMSTRPREWLKTEDFVNKIRVAHKRLFKDPVYKSRILKKLHTKENRDKARQSILNNWQDPEFRKTHLFDPYRSGKNWVRYKDLHLRSQWELHFATLLDACGYTWRYEPRRFEYTYEGRVHSYTPDFYVKELDLYLEVKPKMRTGSITDCKIAAVRNSGCSIMLVTESSWYCCELILRGSAI